MIQRALASVIKRTADGFPVVAILGPRQSGKTTLAKAMFPNHAYISLEDLSAREDALNDPKGFIAAISTTQGVILDEFQHAPNLLSYIQLRVDEHRTPGHFVLTGSQNFLMNKAITQTLAGRVAITTLLPLAIGELSSGQLLPETIEEFVFTGAYPELHVNKNLSPQDWFSSYIKTYVERDVRDIKRIENLSAFTKFMKLCAARSGQLLSYESLANDADISVATVKSWLSLLEASYIIFMLEPYATKFTRRLIKSPKLFFYDAGLASFLLGLDTIEAIKLSPYRGNLIETVIIADIMKNYLNQNRTPHMYFLKDKTGNEIDCVIEKSNELMPIEIKSKMTASQSLFDNITFWQKVTAQDSEVLKKMVPGFVVYTGQEDQTRSYGTFLSWRNMQKISDLL